LSLADRTYLVTGGGSGIGKGVAAALVTAGARVMIVGRNPDRLAAAVSDVRGNAGDSGGAVRYEPTDVTNEDETARAVDAATAWSGRLHGVVHCAGGSETIGPITQIDSDAWRRTVDLNVNGTMYVLKHAARELVRGGGGSFIAISSIAASNTHRWFGAYGPTKSAIDHADAGRQRRLHDQHAAAPCRRGLRRCNARAVPAQRCCGLDHRADHQCRRRSVATAGPGLHGHARTGVRRGRAPWRRQPGVTKR
jgi:NAD(P)-dependent dehydrogenase (short-subunit alcohol dehydrogenase family)